MSESDHGLPTLSRGVRLAPQVPPNELATLHLRFEKASVGALYHLFEGEDLRSENFQLRTALRVRTQQARASIPHAGIRSNGSKWIHSFLTSAHLSLLPGKSTRMMTLAT